MGVLPKSSVHPVSTTIAGSRPTGVRGVCQLEIRRIPVTLATLPQSIMITRAWRDALMLAGGTAAVLGLGPGREREGGRFQQACNRLATCLQLACNYGDTPALPRCCPGAVRGPRPRFSNRKATLLRRSRLHEPPGVHTGAPPAPLPPFLRPGGSFAFIGVAGYGGLNESGHGSFPGAGWRCGLDRMSPGIRQTRIE